MFGGGAEGEGGAARHKAAGIFPGLHWATYGKSFAGSHDLGTRSEPSVPEKKPEGWEQLTPAQRELWYALYLAAMRFALSRRGRHVEAVTMAVVRQLRTPHSAQTSALLLGLDALRSIRPPKLASR
jgi:hypothetical protein